jgi:hypothetical protein
MTLRSVLAFIVAHPRATVNDILEDHGIPLTGELDDAEYFDREFTASAMLTWLEESEFVTFKTTSWDGWKYTATGKEWR